MQLQMCDSGTQWLPAVLQAAPALQHSWSAGAGALV